MEMMPDDLDMITVNLIKPATGPEAKPPSFVAFARAGGGDIVRFRSHYPFTVAFKDGDSPFEWDNADGMLDKEMYILDGTIQEDALPDGMEQKVYPYGMTVDGEPVDPDVVVKKDPRRP